MFEKVNPCHPDKIADRIAGAFVDEAYRLQKQPKVAVEVLIGHGVCNIITESSCRFTDDFISKSVSRISGERLSVNCVQVLQDEHLASNQASGFRCGDNGTFKGMPITHEQSCLSKFARDLFEVHSTDGKYIIDGDKLIVCQSCADSESLAHFADSFSDCVINPLGDWTGGIGVDAGATNRKLGSDMGDAVTGGGLHGKDLSKADVSVNIYAHLMAQFKQAPVELHCAIGDEYVDGRPYSEIVEIAQSYINSLGGFEKFAEWGLI